MKLVQQNHSTIYISRSLSACFTRVPLVHSLMLSRSKQDIGGHTLSQLMAGHKSGRTTSTRAGGVGASFTLSLAAREETNGCPRIPISGRAVLSERVPARECLRPLLPPCGIGQDAASRRRLCHMPTTLRYIFLRNLPCSTAPAPHLASCGSFSTSVRYSKAT